MEHTMQPKDSEEWRNWLTQNHDKTPNVWLTFYKKGSNRKGISLEEAVEEAICFGWIDGKLRRIDEERFVLRFSPRKAKSVWSKINKERAEKLTQLGKMTKAGLAAMELSKASGSWDTAYTNKVKDAVPVDLESALKEQQKAWHNFQAFANSYRNMYIGWVNAAKTDETRKKRVTKVVEQSLQNKKLLGAKETKTA
jgi:uncharacterized protein YdeI (YjbR/CyaY-like superfamily)